MCYLKSDFDDIQRADEGTGDHTCRWPGQSSFLWGQSHAGGVWIIAYHSRSGHRHNSLQLNHIKNDQIQYLKYICKIKLADVDG